MKKFKSAGRIVVTYVKSMYLDKRIQV